MNNQKKLFLFLTAFLLIPVNTFAQDVITLKNGDEIRAKVQEIGICEVKYKKFDNQNGPLYIVMKSEIFRIRYANGSIDKFTDATKCVPDPIAVLGAKKKGS